MGGSTHVVREFDGHVTNVEAYAMLQERSTARKNAGDKERRLYLPDKVMEKAIRYLEKSPAATQQVDRVDQCHKFLIGADGATAEERKQKDLGLSFEERLQILNLAPTGAVVVHLVVKDCEARLSDTKVDEVIQLSAHHLRTLE
ncbi:hypothetical protein M885DRAFT_521184 [Pelagophyceae sp. CCMP2097]|nr:hypothetical protein M885DRAFT_521184 [Pelagophyceae sp. CCMP2097]